MLKETNKKNISDEDARLIALDPTRSYIVQAPAGSGKTELLIQRILKLLTVVNKPEEIVALTFTKKAAAEMKTRIIHALGEATSITESITDVSEHKLRTFELASTVLARDKKLFWGLVDNPARLNITTIDSLCAKIVKQTPIMSNIGGDVAIIDEPINYYKQAIRDVFGLINTNQYDDSCSWTADFKILLQHFSSNYEKLQKFLLSMLYKREQWLPYLVNIKSNGIREVMQYCWDELSNDSVSNIENVIPLSIKTEFDILLDYAANNLKKNKDVLKDDLAVDTDSIVFSIINHRDSKLIYWRAVSALLFTSSGQMAFRKRLDKRLGFPSKADFKTKEEKDKANFFKDNLLSIIADLDGIQQELLINFEFLRYIPDLEYGIDNWRLLDILANILKLLEASLRLIFKNNKITDFSGMAQAASYALGTPDNPSDIGLYFDYNISHILVDEFQDTSYVQYQLLEKLVSIWDIENSANTCKTLFLVGDPMQSIYRFRQAEVGLFLQVRQQGLGHVKLDYLSINKNFRSEQQIVDWVNNKFTNILPNKSNIVFGAIEYSSSQATKLLNQAYSPKLYLFEKNKDSNNLYADENNYIITSIKDIISNIVDGQQLVSIAILVRNRSKIDDLVRNLKQNKILINAVDIESLSERMVIKDLLSLTKSIINLTDRVSWYSVLRAPWCGLSLEELYCLHNKNPDQTIWQILNNPDSSDSLSLKLNNILLVYKNIFNKLYKINFYKIIKQAWYALGGNIIYHSEEDLSDANQFFDLLFNIEESNLILDVQKLEHEVAKLYANHQVNHCANYSVNIMTVHKSKGLQFDYVFLPYLDTVSKVNEHQILIWQQYHNKNIDGFLLAPYHVKKNEQLKFYDALRFIDKQKENFELSRLFYVAVTRAIKSCILTASVASQSLEGLSDIKDLVGKFNNRTILGQIIAVLDTEEVILPSKELINNNFELKNKQIRYINYHQYKLDDFLSGKASDKVKEYQGFLQGNTEDLFAQDVATDNQKQYLLPDNTQVIIGVFIHKIFYNIAKKYLIIDNLYDQKLNLINQNLLNSWRNILLNKGIGLDKINVALDFVSRTIIKTLQSDTGKWILSDHQYSYAEQEFYSKHNNKIKKFIIDRVFLDKDTNSFWIIDYKISQLMEDNIDITNGYKKQLQNYGYLVSNLFSDLIKKNKYNIMLGLYYPVTDRFDAWEYNYNHN